MKRLFVIILILSGFALSAEAQIRNNSDIVISGHGWYGYDIEQSRPGQKSYGYMTYEAAVGFQTDPRGNCPYNQLFGYPMISVGMSVARMGNFQFYDSTEFPNLYSLFGSFERSLLRREHVSLGYQFDFGATYNPGRYDPVAHPGNNWLSSPFMAYFGAGAFVKYHLGKRWEIGADFMFRHYSNGRLDLPNEALNALGGGVFARYRLSDYDYTRYAVTKQEEKGFEKGMQYMVVFGGGVHKCMAEWNAYVEGIRPDNKVAVTPEEKKTAASNLKAHPKFSVSFDALYRYALRYATGVGIDVFYSSNMEALEKSDRLVYGDEAVENCPGYSPVSIGLSVVQEVYWKNLAVHVAIGAYPYRHKGVNGTEAKALGDRERGWHYEKAGLRYYFPKFADTFVGFAIKSHSIKAEYLEFSVGIRI